MIANELLAKIDSRVRLEFSRSYNRLTSSDLLTDNSTRQERASTLNRLAFIIADCIRNRYLISPNVTSQRLVAQAMHELGVERVTSGACGAKAALVCVDGHWTIELNEYWVRGFEAFYTMHELAHIIISSGIRSLQSIHYLRSLVLRHEEMVCDQIALETLFPGDILAMLADSSKDSTNRKSHFDHVQAELSVFVNEAEAEHKAPLDFSDRFSFRDIDLLSKTFQIPLKYLIRKLHRSQLLDHSKTAIIRSSITDFGGSLPLAHRITGIALPTWAFVPLRSNIKRLNSGSFGRMIHSSTAPAILKELDNIEVLRINHNGKFKKLHIYGLIEHALLKTSDGKRVLYSIFELS